MDHAERRLEPDDPEWGVVERGLLGVVRVGRVIGGDAVDHAGRLAGGLRRVHEVAHPAVARCQHTRREDEVGCEAAEARERGRGEQDARPREPDRQVVREGEDPPRVGRAVRVVEDELGRAAHAAAVGEELLPGGEHAELDELDGVVALPAAEHLVDRDQMVRGAGGRRREEDERERCGADAQGHFRILSG